MHAMSYLVEHLDCAELQTANYITKCGSFSFVIICDDGYEIVMKSLNIP